MARYSRLQVWNAIERVGLVPLFYHGDADTAIQVVEALAAGGASVIEFTNRGDRAFEVFRELIARVDAAGTDIILGVGSVLDPATAGLYINLGANFIVGSVTVPEVAKLCNRRKVPYFPGCATPSEVSQAEELGVEIVKVFPGSQVGGPGFVKAITAPCPWTKVMPTGGVRAEWENIKAWFDAGVVAVGMGSDLVRGDLIKEGRWDELTALTAQCLAWVRQARGEALYLGVEHVGLYPTDEASASDLAHWYERLFGLTLQEGRGSFFAYGPGPGRLEIMKSDPGRPCHIAIAVSDFERALEDLRAKGIAVQEPIVRPGSRIAYLEETDPAGNAVHIFFPG